MSHSFFKSNITHMRFHGIGLLYRPSIEIGAFAFSFLFVWKDVNVSKADALHITQE